MEEFFIISRRNIDSSWDLSDLRDNYYAVEYCEQVLDIPEENIMDAGLGAEGLEISLCDLDVDSLYYDDDWYIQLKRISNTSTRAA
jgi:hypothetical protein